MSYSLGINIFIVQLKAKAEVNYKVVSTVLMVDIKALILDNYEEVTGSTQEILRKLNRRKIRD